MSDPIPLILSGDADSQLWPLSRDMIPKQFLKLTGECSPLQEAAVRLGSPPVVVCNAEHRFMVAEQLREIGIEPRAVVVEPVGRGTAPAAAVAALMLAESDPDALMLLMPSDHMISDAVAFRGAVGTAIPLARSGYMVAFGVAPTGPNIDYGYIRIGRPLPNGHAVDHFVEKPDLSAAMGYLASGEYCWNSGIFLLPVGLFLSELEIHAHGMAGACRNALAEGRSDQAFVRLGDHAFTALKRQSIDTAVMERSDKVAVIKVDMGWSDIGSWSKLWRKSPRDADGNVVIGDTLARETTGCYLRSDSQLLTTIGLKDLVVVVTDDAVLVADKAHDLEVTALVDGMKRQSRPEARQGARVWRPWGWFQTIEEGERFKVKQIHVEPGAKLSLQKHWHRSEHWVVVKGTALVTRGDATFVLRENESTFIPATTPHRLENPGKVPLLLIEVQSGEYVGEDDIVRMDDVYGRAAE